METVFYSYWNFLNRPAPSSSVTTGIEALPNVVRDTVLLTAFFSALFVAITPIVSVILKDRFSALPRRKKHELPSYILCLVHHVVAVPVAWSHIYNDFNLTSEAVQIIDYAPITATIAPWCMAYLIADMMFFAIPEALVGKFEYILHHVLTLFLVISSLFAPGSILRFIPHLLISDTTNIFFNSAWLIRLLGGKGSILLSSLEISFALSFFFIRVINMPSMFWVLGSQYEGLGIAKYCLAPIAAMQWYWFYKIVRIIIIRFVKGDTSLEGRKKIS
jgi:TLC domain